jgi:orotate phosphoribosyltransferase
MCSTRSAEALAGLAGPRRGHFDLGTGFHGDLWLDLDGLFSRPARLRPHVRRLAGQLREYRADAVCGPVEGGAILGYAVADVLEVAFLPCYRRTLDAAAYRLPPGRISGWRVAVVDDAVNAGTAAATCCATPVRSRSGGVPLTGPRG